MKKPARPRPVALDPRRLAAVSGGDSAMLQIALQSVMDARQKVIQTLSNIADAQGETASEIIDNLR